ncbi:hypothetical protein SRS16CHR_01613 [Variovorax sp. SRS16]|uniref:DUF1330 domain-containing protein n=1 Tax=Variovorax sp. SRS16 TaxID=282217 RepID=UPI0013165272|nr:DUF1330 domain-containing protein [Variovorax sp. SRS16]VTU15829.1 hypothetical protein SRS16CHR_01613 [Variovorax sp. SRS16]
MSAYWLARSKINDPVRYKRYTDLVPDIIAAHQGRILARGGEFAVLEGPKKFERFVVIQFPSLAHARACYESPAYQAASRHRQEEGAGEVELVIVEAMPGI